jgi:hypothetical protein
MTVSEKIHFNSLDEVCLYKEVNEMPPVSDKGETGIIDRIRRFDLLNASIMDCALFLHTIRKEVDRLYGAL